MKIRPCMLWGLLPVLLAGCATSEVKPLTLKEARSGFKTTLRPSTDPRTPMEMPPPQLFRAARYPAQAGEFGAYLTPDPHDGKKHPAIVWITGGDCNSIGDVWTPGPHNNDQTAAAYRKAGIIMMFPSLRGGNTNPGLKEGFLGEVDDVLAATDYLAKQNYVDPKRIYLGGHSTGGTLVLLVAEYSNRYRGVFAFGPVDDVSSYGQDSGFLPFDISDHKEVQLRSPIYWLSNVQSPTWVMEGTGGNIESLRAMSAKPDRSPNVHFMEIPNANHFETLAPSNELIADKILGDTGDVTNIVIASNELAANFAK